MPGLTYTDEALALQRRFDTTALAAVERKALVHDALTADDRAFIAAQEMFWLSTVDPQGMPTVSFKGGPPGFVRMPDDRSLVFPSYDGNGMFLSLGNLAATAQVGLLFMRFDAPARLRVQGTATLVDDPALLADWPGAQLAVRVAVQALFVNCPRYVPRMQRVAGSRYVPDAATGAAPLAGWKRIDAIQAVLPAADQGRAAAEGGLLDMAAWQAMVQRGDPLA